MSTAGHASQAGAGAKRSTPFTLYGVCATQFDAVPCYAMLCRECYYCQKGLFIYCDK